MFRLFILFFLLTPIASLAAQADLVVSARWVVTMDGTRRVLNNASVAVVGDHIVAVGPTSEILKSWTPKQRIDAADGIIAPGLINTHTHAPMSLLRGIADDLTLQDWLEKFIFPAEAKHVNADFVRWGTRLACLEMMLGGTTTYTDMYYFEEVIAEATKEAGMRAVLGQTVIGFPVADAKTPADALARTEKFFQKYRKDPLITPAVAPHAAYTNSDETLKSCRALANRYELPLIIHLSETKRENDEMIAKRGMTPTKLLESLGVLEGRTLAAHGIWLDDGDLEILKRRNTGLAHCPSSNMKLASGIANVSKILGMGIPMGLGPDGPAGSNNDFDMFEEMDLAAKLAKVSTMNPQALPAMQALEMATITGARALGMDKQIGSLEIGKKADLILVRTRNPHAQPLFNPVSQLVYALKASDVSDVVINGKIVVRNKQSLTLDANTVLNQAALYGAKIAIR